MKKASAALLRLHVQPGASHTGWAGRHGDRLKVRLQAQAQEGKANDALRRFIAGELGVAASSIAIVRGEHSRDKDLSVRGANEDALKKFESIEKKSLTEDNRNG